MIHHNVGGDDSCTRLRSPPRDHRGVDLISDVLPFGRLWYAEPNAAANAINYAKFYSRSHNAVIRVYDEAGSVIETHEQRFPSLRFASAIQIVRPRDFTAETQPQLHPALLRLSAMIS